MLKIIFSHSSVILRPGSILLRALVNVKDQGQYIAVSFGGQFGLISPINLIIL